MKQENGLKTENFAGSPHQRECGHNVLTETVIDENAAIQSQDPPPGPKTLDPPERQTVKFLPI